MPKPAQPTAASAFRDEVTNPQNWIAAAQANLNQGLTRRPGEDELAFHGRTMRAFHVRRRGKRSFWRALGAWLFAWTTILSTAWFFLSWCNSGH